AACGADPAGRQRCRIRHGVRSPGRSDHLEPGNLVYGPARLEFAHADRIDHRCRACESASRYQWHGNQRCGLEPSAEHREVAAILTDHWIRGSGNAAGDVEDSGQEPGVVQSPPGEETTALVDPLDPD